MKENDRIKIACRIEAGIFHRWVITRGDDPTLAWSGARWVPHDSGIPLSDVQVCNFSDKRDAVKHATRCGFQVIAS